MLTGKQLMTTTTRRREPPYRFHELRNIFDVPSTCHVAFTPFAIDFQAVYGLGCQF
jgi:hypothetical protein